jgi:hypothetical protein
MIALDHMDVSQAVELLEDAFGDVIAFDDKHYVLEELDTELIIQVDIDGYTIECPRFYSYRPRPQDSAYLAVQHFINNAEAV